MNCTTSVGIDPGSDYIGLGAVKTDDSGRIIHAELHRVRVAGLSLGDKVVKVDSLLRPLIEGRTIISHEKPPPTARKDTNHSAQANIGYTLGIVSGAIISPYLSSPDIDIRETAVSDWRDNILVFAAINGPAVRRPSRKGLIKDQSGKFGPALQSPLISVPGAGWIGRYGCGHEIELKNFADVQKAPKTCPTCTSKNNTKPDPAKEIRDAWKQIACLIVQKHFPDQYKELISTAREAARKSPLDHQLSGVADAAESLCIALSALPLGEKLKKAV